MTIADNQVPIGRALANVGVAINLGEGCHETPENITETLASLFDDAERLSAMSAATATITDGQGPWRVVAAITGILKLAVVSDMDSWINDKISELVESWNASGHEVAWVHAVNDLPDGDCAFFLGCSQLAGPEVLARNVHDLVVHESALPKGRGWSPLTWQLLEGLDCIPITLFESDSGDIYLTDQIVLNGYELVDELRNAQWMATRRLCEMFIDDYPAISSKDRPQERTLPGVFCNRRASLFPQNLSCRLICQHHDPCHRYESRMDSRNTETVY